MAPRGQQQQPMQSSFPNDIHATQYGGMPANSANLPPSQYTPSTAGPQPAPLATQQAQLAPVSEETLEERLLNLVHPFRDECFTDNDSDPTFTVDQRKVVIMCGTFRLFEACHTRLIDRIENIAFLLRHNQSMYGKAIQPADISIISRHWEHMKQGKSTAGIAVLVNGNGYTHTVVRSNIPVGQKPLDCLSRAADNALAGFFPDIPDVIKREEKKW